MSVDGQRHRLADFARSPVLLVAFICNHCPYVQAIEERLLNLAHNLKSVQTVAICSNDPNEYPEDAPAELLGRWLAKSYGFPYLIDDTQSVARAFGAVCTPDFFVYDSTRRLRYRGRLDDSWRNASKVTRHELKDAIEAILAGHTVNSIQNPAMGCSIKWKDLG